MTPITVGTMVRPILLGASVALDNQDGDMTGIVSHFEGSIGGRRVCVVRWSKRPRCPRLEDRFLMAHYVDQLERVAAPDSLEERVYAYVQKELSQ